ncbi:hypothetical protein [Streptomyces sp. NPDC057199]|uniref:hypothetical protein n=1 Tax=Streptomyces sp. NPDC057199 TaxID=3346047 RepID=UPI003634E970
MGAVVATGHGDDRADELHRLIFQHLLDDQWHHGVETAVDTTLVGRCYEQFADDAVSATRRVVYLATGEHADALPTDPIRTRPTSTQGPTVALRGNNSALNRTHRQGRRLPDRLPEHLDRGAHLVGLVPLRAALAGPRAKQPPRGTDPGQWLQRRTWS